jgi:hypothetical protein
MHAYLLDNYDQRPATLNITILLSKFQNSVDNKGNRSIKSRQRRSQLDGNVHEAATFSPLKTMLCADSLETINTSAIEPRTHGEVDRFLSVGGYLREHTSEVWKVFSVPPIVEPDDST